MILTTRSRHGVVVLCGLMVVGAACHASRADSGRIRVVASFYPLAEAAERVGGDHVRVTNLTPAGAEPHDLELTTSQRAQLQDADLVLTMGHGFQPAVEKAAHGRRSDVALLPLLASSTPLRANDPHVWLDPVLMQQLVARVRDALVRVDGDHAADYRARGDAYIRDLHALDNDYATRLRSCARHEIVTSHAAFGYLASRYGLRQQAIAGLDPEAEPNPQRLSELIDLVQREHITTVFSESLVSAKIARTLAREANAQTEILNPLEGLTRKQRRRGETYVSVMRVNLTKLAAALGCA